MREIVLDTETTGLDPKNGDRLIEIGCVELVNRLPTGNEYHVFINPERDVPIEAQNIHGISTAFLKDKPLFAAVAGGFVDFIGGDTLVIHNANFDIGFLNAELTRVKRQPISMVRVIDTLAMARRKHPAGPNTLDALMDSLLLAEVYMELLGERQAALGLSSGNGRVSNGANGASNVAVKVLPRPVPLPSRLTEAELAAHAAFIAQLGEKAIWVRYGGE